MLDAIKAKIDRGHDLTIKRNKKDPIADSPADRLILQRFLGHREEWPGSAQWYQTSARGAFRTDLKGQEWREGKDPNEGAQGVKDDWYMEDINAAVAYKPHYKSNCWMCEGHIYTIFFWSKGMAYKLNPIFDKDKSEVLRYEIDKDFVQDQQDNY